MTKMNEPRMNMLTEISLTEKGKFCVETRNVKLIELSSRKVVTRGWVVEKMGRCCPRVRNCHL